MAAHPESPNAGRLDKLCKEPVISFGEFSIKTITQVVLTSVIHHRLLRRSASRQSAAADPVLSDRVWTDPSGAPGACTTWSSTSNPLTPIPFLGSWLDHTA